MSTLESQAATEDNTTSATESDSHADSPVVGMNSAVLRNTGKRISVKGFTDQLGAPIIVPVVDAAVVYECELTGSLLLLIIRNALLIHSMKVNLIPPFMMRLAGLEVNECPKFLSKNPTINDHSIYCPQKKIRIPFQLNGIISIIPTRKPTQHELDTLDQLELTPMTDNWDPHNERYGEQEYSMTDYRGELKQKRNSDRMFMAASVDSSINDPIAMIQSCTESHNISSITWIDQIGTATTIDDENQAHKISSVFTGEDSGKGVDPKVLCKKWNIPLMVARKVTETTIRLCKRNTNTISLNRRYAINDRMLRYNRLRCPLYTDTLLASERCVSVRGYTCAQIFASEFGFIFPCLMRKRADMSLATKRLFKEIGVPTELICDRAREQYSGDNLKLCEQSGCTIKELEKGTPQADRAERYIQMAKNETKDDMGSEDSPLVFWCYTLERRGKIINAVPRNNYLLQGQCPMSKMTGQPYDISPFCEFSWYEWIKYRLHGEKFPFPMKRLGRCLGPSSDKGNAMSQYVLTDKGTVIPIQTLRSLTPAEYNSPTETQARNAFDNFIKIKYGDSRHPPKSWKTRHRGKRDDTIDDAKAIELAEEETMAHDVIEQQKEDRRILLEKDEMYNNDMEIAALSLASGNTSYESQRIGSSTTNFVMYDDYDKERPSTTYDEWLKELPNVRVFQDKETGEVHEELQDVDDIDDYDKYLTAEVLLPQDGEHLRAGTVVNRTKSKDDGSLLGTANTYPSMDTRVYDVMFPDGAVQQYSANIIAQNLYSQIDEEGHRYQLLEGIIQHRKNGDAVPMERGLDKRNRKRMTTKGWDLCLSLKDGTSCWMPLKEVKNIFPIEVAEYAVMTTIDKEPAFAWWVPHTIKKKDNIISKVASRMWKRTYKFGIEVPGNVREAYELDIKNKNDYWKLAIAKEMKNNRVAFEVIPEGESPPHDYQQLECYMIFDIKMDMTRKARYVANGSKTTEPSGSKYAGVVSRESVRIAFTYAALNDLDILAADIQNAYLQAPCSEKFWVKCGKEFGPQLEGRLAIIVRALYGTKSSGRDFRNHLRDCMEHMGYRSCRGDPDVWVRKGIRDNGQPYYEYMLLYVDDALCCSEHPKETLMELNKYFPLKKDSMGPPKIYLGGKVSKVQLPNGVTAWAISSSQYIQEAVSNVEKHLKNKGETLMKGSKAPLSSGYHPECDISTELNTEDASYYQSLIGILRWIVEMGRIDVCCEVSVMSSHVALPREGHLQQLYRMMAYLKRFHNARLVLDPTYPDIDDGTFQPHDWTNFYGRIKEDIPQDAPDPLGPEFIIRVIVDASHASNKVNRRSRTGFIVFLNNAAIYWYSKKQGGIEGSTFGSEFIAMKTACEYVRGLRYKLRTFGLRVSNPAFIYGDNQSVLWNVAIPDSMLKKKSYGIAYHLCREGAAKEEWMFGYINTNDNLADGLSKCLPAGKDRVSKVQRVLYDIHEGE